MEQKLIECTEVAQGYSARVIKANGIYQVEIWDLDGGEFPVVCKLTPNEIYCIGGFLIFEDFNVIRDAGFHLPDTEKNNALIKTYGIKKTILSKIEVSIEEFINICKNN